MRTIFFLSTVLFFCVSCLNKAEHKSITSVNDLAKVDFSNGKNVLLDVRTPEEFAEGNIPNSVNLDYNSADFDSLIKELDSSKTYYIYCKSGNRSTKASAKMQAIGFKKIINLQDGYKAYKK